MRECAFLDGFENTLDMATELETVGNETEQRVSSEPKIEIYTVVGATRTPPPALLSPSSSFFFSYDDDEVKGRERTKESVSVCVRPFVFASREPWCVWPGLFEYAFYELFEIFRKKLFDGD